MRPMSKLSWLCAIALISAPLTVAAAPASVSSRTTGLMGPGNGMLSLLGLAPSAETSQPYDLTISAILDPASSSYHVRPNNPIVEQGGTQVSLSFDFGSQHYEYSGLGSVLLTGGDNWYSQQISFFLPGSTTVLISAGNEINIPGSHFDEKNPPSLLNVDVSHTYTGGGLSSRPDPNDPAYGVVIHGNAQSLTMTNVSAIPEPAPVAMASAGLLVMLAGGAWRRRARTGART